MFFLGDYTYKRYFENETGPEIYRKHICTDYISCTFCSHLQRSTCHAYCFKCSRKIYSTCGCLTPGTFNFQDSFFALMGTKLRPWIFATPCTAFDRLEKSRYFKHFTSLNNNITVTFYETLEAIYTGRCQSRRPCHICASVDISIYDKCTKEGLTSKADPCNILVDELATRYGFVPDFIRYA